ncbi:deoxycytidyl transferase [Tulasnella sp. 332]|nr:deoxycytidyl transferase [Tulasnella sp. 332]
MSSDADLWGSQEDLEYIDALANARLPSPPQRPATNEVPSGDSGDRKRKRRSSSPILPVISTSEAYNVDLDEAHISIEGEGDDDDLDLDVNPALFTRQRKRTLERPDAKNESYVYGAANFGGFGEYMFRKRAKLQFQNQDLSGEGEATGKKIFKGVAIYVNGFTDPPFQVLREMLMAHGGVFQAYLDKKSIVTHIVASQLTPAKIIEYQKGKMKVVTPEWIVKSVEAGTRLRWQDFALKPGMGSIAAHGKGTGFTGVDGAGADVDRPANMSTKPSQKTLLETLVSQPKQRKPDPMNAVERQKPPVSFRQMLSGSSSSSQSQKEPESPLAPSRTQAVNRGAPREATLQKGHENSDATETSVALPPNKNVDGKADDITLETLSPNKQAPIQLPILTTTSPTPTRTLDDSSRTNPTTTIEDAHSLEKRPRYALHDSNPFAAKLMQSTQWRNEHTSANAAGFVESYYQNSRLHHLSTWKSELRALVSEARERAESGDGVIDVIDVQTANGVSMQGVRLDGTARQPSTKEKGKAKAEDISDEKPKRVIMHCDFDSFFVAAGLVSRPQLKGKPVVVCHTGGEGGKASTSEIASAGYEARKFGIKNGMSLGQARQLCADVVSIPYEFEKYKGFSLQFYTILMSFADDLQAVSVDEALIDVSQRVAQAQSQADAVEARGEDRDAGARDFAKELAEQIRDKVREVTSCEVSIGISHNILLARMATRKAKPANSYHLLLEEVPEHLAPLRIQAIHGVGHSIRDKIQDKFNVETLGELLPKSKQSLQHLLGEKTGEKIWKAVRGIDDTPLESDKPRKSVSAEVNYGIRFENEDQAETFMYTLSIEVSKRLRAVNRKGRLLTLKVMVRNADAPKEAPKFMGHGKVDHYNKSMAISGPGGVATDDPKIIGDGTWSLLRSFHFDPSELRGIGIQIQKLDDGGGAGPKLDPGQSKLSFMKVAATVGDSSKGKGKERAVDNEEETIPIVDIGDAEVPSKHANRDMGRLELPSASQIDQSVFESLPEDLQREILAGLALPRDQTGFNVDVGTRTPNIIAGPSNRAKRGAPISVPLEDDDEIVELGVDEVAALKDRTGGHTDQSRSQSVPVPRKMQARATTLDPPRVQDGVKALSMSPTKMSAAARLASVKHITRQLAPKRKAPVLSPTKISLFKGKAPRAMDTDDSQLRDLGVDPVFFRELPADIQKEQLEMFKQARPTFAGMPAAGRGVSLPVPDDSRRVWPLDASRSRSPSMGVGVAEAGIGVSRSRPIPVASYTIQPRIKKLGEVGEVQDMVRDWVKYRLEDGPIAGEVNRMLAFLVKTAETDIGLEKVADVMRFWRLLLRTHWPRLEREVEDEVEAGALWWKAFRETKQAVDTPVKARFGCTLALGR